MKEFRCPVCGYEMESNEEHVVCPLCGEEMEEVEAECKSADK